MVQRSERKFMEGMNEHVQNLKEDEWRIAHGHINSLHINETEYLLYEWRSTVEKQGCHMVNTIMLRDPLDNVSKDYGLICNLVCVRLLGFKSPRFQI